MIKYERKWCFDIPVSGKPMLKMLWLVVLCCEGSFVQGVFGGVSLRSGFNVHERNRRWGTPGARRADVTNADTTDTDASALAPLTTGATIDGAFFSPWQQLDALYASIPETIVQRAWNICQRIFANQSIIDLTNITSRNVLFLDCVNGIRIDDRGIDRGKVAKKWSMRACSPAIAYARLIYVVLIGVYIIQ